MATLSSKPLPLRDLLLRGVTEVLLVPSTYFGTAPQNLLDIGQLRNSLPQAVRKQKFKTPGIYRRTRPIVEIGDSCLTDSNPVHKWEYYGKFEPRFKPPREALASGETLQFSYLPLGGYDTEEDARVVHQIAAFFYGKGQNELDLGDGHRFSIDSSLSEQERCLKGKEKAKWVSIRAKKVFEDFKKAKAARGLLIEINGPTCIHSDKQIINACDLYPAKDSDAFLFPAIHKNAEELVSTLKLSLLAESGPDGELHGPPQSSTLVIHVDMPAPDRAHDFIQYAPQHVRAFGAPAMDKGYNLVALEDINACPEYGNIGVCKKHKVGDEIFQPVEPALRRSSTVHQNSSVPMLVPASVEHCAPVGGSRSVTFDLPFRTKEIETYVPLVPQYESGVSKFSLDDLCNIPEGQMIELPRVQPYQQLQDNQVLDSGSSTQMFVDHNPSDTEPVGTLPAWASEGNPNVVQESSVVAATMDKVDEGALIVHEGALHYSQATDYPNASIASVLPQQQGSDAMVVHLDMIAPSLYNSWQTRSSDGLLVILAQQIQDRDKKIEEQAKLISFLKQELQERDKKSKVF